MIKDDSSEAKKTAALAISIGSASFLMGICWISLFSISLSGAESIMLWTIAVLVNTGWIELHLTRLVDFAQCKATDLERCLTAALEELYAAVLWEATIPDIDEIFISRSIIGSTFETKIKEEFTNNGKQMIKPLIKGSAFITGKQELYVSKDDPFPEGYRLNDTWPDIK